MNGSPLLGFIDDHANSVSCKLIARTLAYGIRSCNMVVFAGQGDPRRTMALLWRASAPQAGRTAPGPKPGLSVDVIVEAAIAVADADNMDGLSMRAVGKRFPCSTLAFAAALP